MKVGKAIYNILSQSTDVQSNFPFNTTDYSPTGTELVTNGDFSAGVEQADALTSWTAYTSGTSTVTYDGSTAELNIDASNSNVGIYQDNIFSLGKSYKIVLSMKATAAFDAEIVESNSAATISTIGSVSLTTSYQDFTFYYVGTGTYDLFIHRLYSGGGSSQTISIQSVSVKELGEGWNLSAVGGISFNGGGLSLDSSEIDTSGGGTVYSSCTQVGTIIEIGKSYKLVIDNLNISSGNIELKFGLDHTTTPTRPILTTADNGTYTDYFTAQTVNDGFTINSAAGTVATLSSISVEEMVLNKIFPELAPPDIDAPYVVYSVVSNSPSDTKNANGDIDTASIEVYGFQDTYNKAVDLGVSVRAALDRKTGTYNTIEIQSTNYVNEQMDVNEARKLWAAIQDYSIRIKNL